MNLETIKKELLAIWNSRGDPEEAHCREDALMSEFISHVATHGKGEIKTMAIELLELEKMNLTRWYA